MTSIVVEGGVARGVRLASGATIAADIVVSNADSAWTYRHLLPASARSRWTDRKIERARYSMGLFVWYFGTRRQYADVGPPHDPAGSALPRIARRYFPAQDSGARFQPLSASADGDRSLAGAARMRCVLCALAGAQSPGRPGLARSRRSPIGAASRRRWKTTVLPGLTGEIATSRVTTPQDFQDRLCSFAGAAFGLEPVLTQSAWFRPHNRSEDIRNLFLVGAGTHPGAGLPGVLSSARILDKVAPDASVFA